MTKIKETKKIAGNKNAIQKLNEAAVEEGDASGGESGKAKGK